MRNDDEPKNIHRATSEDGTVIGGYVYGEGPPLVLAHGGMDDGELSWGAMLPLLTKRFTCYVPAMRGRGLSEDSDDHRPERHAEDLAAFIDSIGEPVGFVGHSTGGTYGLGAVERGANVHGLALHEPAVFQFWEEGEDAERYGAAIASGTEALEEGRSGEAARIFLRGVGVHDDELQALDDLDLFGSLEKYLPALLKVLEQAMDTEAPSPNDPSELAKVKAPTLLLCGSRACDAHRDGVFYLSEQLDDARVHDIDGVGHVAPIVNPEPVAEAVIDFFSE